MTRRFIPPAIEAFGDGPKAEAARNIAAARDAAYVEGRDVGWQQGHAAGFRDGEASARKVCEAELSALRAEFARRDCGLRVAEALQLLLTAREEDQRGLETSMRTAIIAALQTLFPAFLDAAAGREVATLLADTLAERTADTLTLHAHPDMVAAVEAENLAPEAAARLTLVPDATLAHGAAILEWAGGGVAFDPAALLERVAMILRPCPTTSETLPA